MSDGNLTGLLTAIEHVAAARAGGELAIFKSAEGYRVVLGTPLNTYKDGCDLGKIRYAPSLEAAVLDCLRRL